MDVICHISLHTEIHQTSWELWYNNNILSTSTSPGRSVPRWSRFKQKNNYYWRKHVKIFDVMRTLSVKTDLWSVISHHNVTGDTIRTIWHNMSDQTCLILLSWVLSTSDNIYVVLELVSKSKDRIYKLFFPPLTSDLVKPEGECSKFWGKLVGFIWANQFMSTVMASKFS